MESSALRAWPRTVQSTGRTGTGDVTADLGGTRRRVVRDFLGRGPGVALTSCLGLPGAQELAPPSTVLLPCAPLLPTCALPVQTSEVVSVRI